MYFPARQQIHVPLLLEIERAGGEARPSELYQKVAKHFLHLTESDLAELQPHGDNKWRNIVQEVRKDLVNRGEIDGSIYGLWKITEKGRRRLRDEGSLPREGELALHQMPPTPPTPDKLAEEIRSLLQQLVELAREVKEEKPLPNHGELVQIIKEMGEMLGKSTEPVPQSQYRHDCVWKPNRWANPELVWEVCDKGVPEKDIVSLTWAANTLKAKGILAVFGEADFKKAQETVAQPQVYVMKAEDVVQLHWILKAGNVLALRAILGI